MRFLLYEPFSGNLRIASDGPQIFGPFFFCGGGFCQAISLITAQLPLSCSGLKHIGQTPFGLSVNTRVIPGLFEQVILKRWKLQRSFIIFSLLFMFLNGATFYRYYASFYSFVKPSKVDLYARFL